MVYRLKSATRKLYLALENLNFTWSTEDVVGFQKLWFHGFSLGWIAESFNRDMDEVALLVIDLAHLGLIKSRINGLKTSPPVPLEEKIVSKLFAHINREKFANYTVLEEFNFSWDEDEVSLFRKHWNDGIPLLDIAQYFNRHEIEVVLLIIDQAKRDLINQRKFGVYGRGGEVDEFVTNCSNRANYQSRKNPVFQLSLS